MRPIARAVLVILSGLWLTAMAAAQPPSAGPLPRSPEVHADGRVTFRLLAPNATEVSVAREGANGQPAAMVKDASGIWSVTIGPLEPDFYGYSFSVDGARVLDAVNPMFKGNLLRPVSLLHVPGPRSLPWEIADVPHGVVHHHRFASAATGGASEFFVYTPPGYDPAGTTRYPVLYLLHGNSDAADTWSSDVGRADIILDNLIAQGLANPMVVVMPDGYGTREVLRPVPAGAVTDPELTRRNRAIFRQSLLTEVLPHVERAYRVSSERQSRAIAGLSMGGGEALTTGLTALDQFAWVGTFSSGSLEPFDVNLPSVDSGFTPRPALLWIACGTEDARITANRRLRAWLLERGVEHTGIETPGDHTWMVWRRNLAAFVPLLFKPAKGEREAH